MNEKSVYNDLAKNGFVIIDLLNVKEIADLNILCNQYLKASQQDFISSSHFLSTEDSKIINAELHKVIQSKIELLFPELELLGGTLATKLKSKSVLKAHNDWSIVHESKFDSYNLWTPLVDTNKQNGTLGLIPASHLWKHSLRGLGIKNQFESYTNEFLEMGYEPELKAGQAILYNHKLIHYSRANTTDQPRNVAIIGMKDKEAELEVSFSLDSKTIETYAVAEEDFYGFNAKKISEHHVRLNSQSVIPSTIKWNEILYLFSENVSDEFAYLIPKRQSFFSKFLNKF